MDGATANAVLEILDKANAGIYEFLLVILRGTQNLSESVTRQRSALLDNMGGVLDLLEEQAHNQIEPWALSFASETYRGEIVSLIGKGKLHFKGTRATLEQLEEFSMVDLGGKIAEASPHLWDLIGTLLDAESSKRRRAAPHGDIADIFAKSEAEPDAIGDQGIENESQDTDDDDDEGQDEELGASAREDDAMVVDVIFEDEPGPNDAAQVGSESSDDSEWEDIEDEDDVEGGDAMQVDDVEGPVNTSASKAKCSGKKKRKLRKQDRAKRNAALIFIKQIVVLSILGNSSNEACNALQCVLGFFCESKSIPEVLAEVFSHMGVASSLSTTRNMVRSLRLRAKKRLEEQPWSNSIYDNFDMDFNSAQPTVEKQGSHMSATAATFTPLVGATKEDLRFTKELHETSQYNKRLRPNDPKIYRPTLDDILPKEEPAPSTPSPGATDTAPDPLVKAFAWHIRSILVEHGPSVLRKCRSKLGLPDEVDALLVQKTRQFPASAIDANGVAR